MHAKTLVKQSITVETDAVRGRTAEPANTNANPNPNPNLTLTLGPTV